MGIKRFSRPAPNKKRPWLTVVLIACGLAYSLFLLNHVQDEVFYSGDGGLKALLVKQFARGEIRASLEIPAPEWVENLWRAGFYPFQPPFVFQLPAGSFLAFPIFFPLLSVPFFKLLGYKGLYILPTLFLWALWFRFLFLARKLGFQEKTRSLSLAVLAFGTPLTIYGAIFWEHTLGVFLAFCGLEFLIDKGRKASSPISFFWGILTGLAVWIRSEAVCLVAVYCLIGLYFFFKSFRSSWLYFFLGSITSGALLMAVNMALYGHPFGVHSFQVIGDNPGKRLFLSSEIFLSSIRGLLQYSPVLIFVILALAANYFWRKKKTSLSLPVSSLLFIGTTFLLLAPFTLPNIGGRQWGPRYFLVLLPIFILLAAYFLELIFASEKKFQKFTLLAVFFITSFFGIYKNSILGTEQLVDNYRHRIKPALDFVRQNKNDCVIVNHQYIAQELEAAFDSKHFFCLSTGSQLPFLVSKIQERGYSHCLFISYRRLKIGLLPGEFPLVDIQSHFLARYGDYDLYEWEFIPK
ncbi:MAG: hypothetical protein WCC06_07945 [Candidatus Aminicenantales bacterium]